MKDSKEQALNNIPGHIAIIMDGNGRWARKRNLPKIAGHRAGVIAVKRIIAAAAELGVKILTLYTFSTENWQRPRREVSALMGLLDEYITKELDELKKKNIRLVVLGAIEDLPDNVRGKLSDAIRETKENNGLILNMALNYGSRAEMVKAAREIALDAANGAINVEDIDEKMFSDRLYTKGQHDPELVIRTSGEMRISNFLLWQISYSEFYFTKKFWPDFTKNDLKKAIKEYQKRERRFGGQ